MRRGRPPLKALTLTSEAREELESLAHSRTLPHGHVRRAKIVLMCSDRSLVTQTSKRPLLLHPYPRLVAQRDRDLVQYPVEKSSTRRQFHFAQVRQAITDFTEVYNATAHPFEWKATEVRPKNLNRKNTLTYAIKY